MRNWNRDLINCNFLGADSFYSTYEELKPCGQSRKVRRGHSFYSTYEELKLR